MPLPTTKPVQSSIRSFFTSSTPKYAPPPGQSSPPPPAPPPSTLKQQTQQEEKQEHQEQDQQEQKQQQEEHQEQEEKYQQQEQQEHQQQEEQDQQDQHQKHQQPNIPLPSPPSKSTIPPSATIRIPTEDDLPPFRRINALLLQVAYSESYYASTLHNPLARVITWSHDGQDPKVVGAVVCLIEDADADADANTHDPQGDEPPRDHQTLYIRSMCLLAPYRGLGLAQAALEDILEEAQHRNVNFVSITAHVWTENEDGLRWYKGRGFEKDSVKPIEGYYLRLRPGTAWLVRKPLPDNGAVQNRGFMGQRNGNGKGEREEREVVIPESVTAAVVNMPPPPPPPPAAAAAAAATTPASGPSSTPTLEMRPAPLSGQSYQNQRPETEWNDLPEDMAPPRASALRGKAAGSAASGAGAGAGAGGKKKRDRSYPAAAFGS
ncbi:hypothetical protein E4U32_005390 [Claviceps aff. humidiphila group G2b]|nr:hypothetical protein E4U32_005390 [Claviceps aff. humidiphila group G2b]